jgi:gliding motility-associated-like protein
VAAPTVSVAGPPQSVCGITATLAGNVAAIGTGTWTLISGAGTITIPGSPTSGITGLGLGANVFEWTITNAPCAPSTSQVTITGEVPPNAGTSAIIGICPTGAPSDLFLLLGGADLGGTWTGGPPALTNGDQGTYTPGFNVPGVYTYTVSGVVCPDSVTTVTVNLSAGDDPSFVYPDFCAGTGGTPGLITTPGGIFSFNPDPGDGATIVPSTGVIANEVAGGIYNIQYITPAGPCQDSVTIAVNIGTPANAGIDSALTACSIGGTTDLFTLLVGADGGGTWLPALTSGTGVFDPLLDAAGTYQYIVTGVAPCGDDTSDVVVTINTTDLFTLLVGADGGGTWLPALTSGTGVFDPATDPAGTYKYIVTGIAPCGDDTSDVVVTINTAANAGTDSTYSICATGTPIDLYSLLGVADLGGTWLPAMTSGTGVFDPATDPAGTYQYIVTGVAPCGDDTSDVVVTITATDDPTFTYANFCAGSGGLVGTVNTPGGTFSFNPDPGDGSTIVPATGAISNGVGGSTYSIQYITPAGPCQDSSTISVSVNTPPNAGTSSTLTACSTDGTTDLFTLIGAADVGGIWSPAMTSGTGVFDPGIDPAGTYQYLVNGIAPCGNDSVTVTVTLSTSGNAGTNSTLTACSTDGSTDLFPLLGVADLGGVWSPAMASGTGVFDPAVDVGGNYVYTITNSPCAPVTATITVTVNTVVNAGTSNTITLCDTDPVSDLFNLLGSADVGGIWSPIMNSGTGVFNPALDAPGVYTYTVTGIAPCIDATADVNVIIDNSGCDPVQPFVISNMLTPNGDGKNDTWIITNVSQLEGDQVMIFNRWGSKVFETSSYNNDWNGTHNGQDLPDGSYYYVIEHDGEVIQGPLTLLRTAK